MATLDEWLQARDGEAIAWVESRGKRDKTVRKKVALFLLDGHFQDDMPVRLVQYQYRVLEALSLLDENTAGQAPPD